ncbi:hypothetical protein [Changchengzhania lutea]|uniref:hypothetical protein n=1 Tax=Changchengzhania lutea TaxID=2049305 RepID=UPI00115F1F05|nr:hypothetical protein [Changchengzhania lutea]
MKISNGIISFLLAITLLLNALYVSVTYAYYNIDTLGFIEKLCKNKDAPELQCNGKCHLKKVSQSQNKEQKTPESIDFKVLLLYINTVTNHLFLQQNASTKQIVIAYQNLYSFSRIKVCFHPPQV